MAKTTEIVIYDSRRKQQHMPPPLPDTTACLHTVFRSVVVAV